MGLLVRCMLAGRWFSLIAGNLMLAINRAVGLNNFSKLGLDSLRSAFIGVKCDSAQVSCYAGKKGIFSIP